MNKGNGGEVTAAFSNAPPVNKPRLGGTSPLIGMAQGQETVVIESVAAQRIHTSVFLTEGKNAGAEIVLGPGENVPGPVSRSNWSDAPPSKVRMSKSFFAAILENPTRRSVLEGLQRNHKIVVRPPLQSHGDDEMEVVA